MRGLAERLSGLALFRCPECCEPLADLACPACGALYGREDGIPDLLGSGPRAERCREIAAYYDGLYASRTDVWREQGHTEAFTRYVADLVEAEGPGRYLDVGCGEGFFLAEAKRMDAFGIDLSRAALRRARERSGATVAVAAAERLPFPDGVFDVITSVGAMEHFLDDSEATTEIRRVLRRGGRYVLAVLVELTLRERAAIKAREFLWPRPRPVRFARWVLRRAAGRGGRLAESHSFPLQPVQNRYGARDLGALLRRSGFRMARVMTKATCPEAPLPGHHMRVYCLDAV